jgi:hypothetical protein
MMYKRECRPHTASSRGGVSEENVITCKFEDILPLGFTLNSVNVFPNRLKPIRLTSLYGYSVTSQCNIYTGYPQWLIPQASDKLK